MRFGLYMPCYGEYANPRRMSELALEVEQAGWDGLFISDHLQWLAPAPQPVADPWIMLTAMAMSMQHMKLGILVTPIARRRPWKLARETVTLDHLSGGRLVVGAGIGGDWIGEYSAFGEPADDKFHAAQLDEGLQVLAGLWSGQPFSFDGKHYQIKNVQFLPTPIQQPRIPIWVAGGWPHKQPFRRAARWDGVIPFKVDGLLTPDDCREIVANIQQQGRSDEPFDLVCYESTIAEDGVVGIARIADFAEAGVTWWLHGLDMNLNLPLTTVLDQVRQGPPQMH
jgi:alkanesulfonate monooxygenase SsuD/methylene tetrahydromethanopterin reductase-like flavin-dependent oxidoreductase (luciferase family)